MYYYEEENSFLFGVLGLVFVLFILFLMHIAIAFSLKLINPEVCVYSGGKFKGVYNKIYVESKSLGNQTQIKIKRFFWGIDRYIYQSKDTYMTTECDKK